MRNLWTTMALIRYIGRIWPSVPNVLYDAMRHNLPNVINHASQLLLPGKICFIVPQATVCQCPPEPLVVFSAFCVVGDPCVASSQGLDAESVMHGICRRKSQAAASISLGPVMGCWFSVGGTTSTWPHSVAPLEEANCRQRHGILIPWHGETFAARKER